ncbi:hypothetical protein J4226_05785 [Candidatus Pacearchaeota archaeon]|nr:hypothetical protein [Candidatus Pacearchaeota archaeon]
MKKIIFLILLCTTLATASTVSFNFDPNQDSSQTNPNIIYENSIVLQITTTSQVLCRYSTTKDTPFVSMEGFDDNFETIHKKTLINLHDGVYKYYVKCRPIADPNNASTGVAQLEAVFKISNPISAQISLSQSPLKAGKYEVSLLTTKIPATTPLLKYSFDGITYNPIILYGSENSWEGFLVISSTMEEEVGSFKFEARDLEGRTGTQIIGNNVFIVDTRAPPLITSLEASGEYGQIKLDWFLDKKEDIEEINIYKSENPNVDLTNFYKKLEGTKEEYTDTGVKNGKTYYYRISSSDAAGNTADLSREVSATSLLSKTSSSTSGLSASLVGSVDALLSEIELLQSDIENSDDMISDLTPSETEYMKTFKITDNFESAKLELANLKKTVENYKSTDLAKDLLDSRLNSARVKLSILRKKIPDTFSTTDSLEITQTSTEDLIRKAILEYSPEFSPSLIDKTVKKSMQLIEDENLQIKSKLGVFQVTYLDGNKEDFSIIEHSLNSELEKTENTKFLLQFPSGSLDLSSLIMKNIDYTPEQEGLISFETDTKKITYTFNQKLDTQTLSLISVSLISLQEETTPLTGHFLSSVPTTGSSIATYLVLIASGLIGYLFFVKQQQKKQISLEFLEKAKQVKLLQKDGKLEEANKLYDQLKIEYIGLSGSQKREVFQEIKHLTKQ